MSFENPLVLAIIILVVIVAGWWLATHFFSEEARLDRRRRRSNAPIASKSRRPMVKLFTRVKKTKKH